jgi:hypothetical protein
MGKVGTGRDDKGRVLTVLKTAPGGPSAADDASVAYHRPDTVAVGHKVRQPAPVWTPWSSAAFASNSSTVTFEFAQASAQARSASECQANSLRTQPNRTPLPRDFESSSLGAAAEIRRRLLCDVRVLDLLVLPGVMWLATPGASSAVLERKARGFDRVADAWR